MFRRFALAASIAAVVLVSLISFAFAQAERPRAEFNVSYNFPINGNDPQVVGWVYTTITPTKVSLTSTGTVIDSSQGCQQTDQSTVECEKVPFPGASWVFSATEETIQTCAAITWPDGSGEQLCEIKVQGPKVPTPTSTSAPTIQPTATPWVFKPLPTETPMAWPTVTPNAGLPSPTAEATYQPWPTPGSLFPSPTPSPESTVGDPPVIPDPILEPVETPDSPEEEPTNLNETEQPARSISLHLPTLFH